MQQESICPENSIIVHASKYACFAGYILLETEIDIDKIPDPKNILRRQLSSHLQTYILRILLMT